MASPPLPSARTDLDTIKTRVLTLRGAAYALSTAAAMIAAVVTESERTAILALLAGLVLAFSIVLRRSIAGRLDVCLAIDAGGAAVLWWLFGPVAWVDFVLFYVVAGAALLLTRGAALRIVGFLIMTTLLQLVIHLPDIADALPFFHRDQGGVPTEEILFRAILVVGAAIMFFTIARTIERSSEATAESEERFRNLVEASPDAIVVHDGSAILYANAASADLIRALSPDDLIGKPVERIVHTGSPDSAHSDISRALQGETVRGSEMKLVRLDGVVIHVESVSIPTRYHSKPASQVILRDITERHLANQALRESEERYKSFFEGVPTPLYRTTPGGRILDANAALISLLGYPDKASLLNLEVQKAYVRPSDRTASQEILEREGSLAGYEQELLRYDGTPIWVRDTSRIVADGDGSVLYYEGAMVDITQRKQAEETTRRLIRILEATPDFVIIADEIGHILYANQAARNFAKITDDAAVRKLRVRDVLATEETGTLTEIMQSDIWTGILSLRSPDGSQSPASTVVINHRDDEGHIEYFSAVARDISERLAAEARLEQLVRAKDDFVASVSHELRTPLTAVVGLTQELRDDWDRFTAAETSEFISLIADQSTEVANLVEDLLVAARADIGKVTITSRETHVGQQVAAVLAALGMDGNASISVYADDGARALADATRVRQIIRNLLTNAVRYGGARIELAVRDSNDSVLITVTDNGPGIPEERRESIFEPYERAHAESTQPASVGLGLTVSRQLARLMGGDLTYRSGSSGSSFELSLPAYSE
jgi:PAS domain S-box-containing protein